MSIAAKCLIALSGLFSPNLIDQSSRMILTTHAKARPILHDDWSIRLGENILYRSLQTFGGYAVQMKLGGGQDYSRISLIVSYLS